MSLARLIVQPPTLKETSAQAPTSVSVRGGELHHLLRVLRLATGDRFVGVMENTGQEMLCSLKEIGQDEATADVLKMYAAKNSAGGNVTLVIAAARPKVCDAVVERAVELGIKRLVFFEAVRSQGRASASARETRLARFIRIAQAALKQSGAGVPPKILFVSSLSEALSQLKAPSAHRIICAEPDLVREEKIEQLPFITKTLSETQNRQEKSAAALSNIESPSIESEGENAEIIIVVGPEGGLTPEEYRLAREFGYSPVSLGPRTLKVETAAILACGVAALTLATKDRGEHR